MTKPTINLQELQARIGHRAKSAPTHRFWGLYVHIKKHEVIEAAYLEAKKNKGAPGADGVTFARIEQEGRAEFLREIVDDLEQGTYCPQPYRRRDIPKDNGKVRTISIPAIRDRVVHGATNSFWNPSSKPTFRTARLALAQDGAPTRRSNAYERPCTSANTVWWILICRLL